MPEEEIGFGKRHFEIRFNKNTACYEIKDLGDGTGTFVKIVSNIMLKPGYIVSFGDVHFAVAIPTNNQSSVQKTTMDKYYFIIYFL